MKRSESGRRPFVVREGRASGSVRLVARAAIVRSSCERESSVGGVSRIRADGSVRADQRLRGLNPVTGLVFRYRTVTKRDVGDWNAIVSKLVA